MSAIPSVPLDRAAINRANSQHSTGPRTEAGKQRSSLNAVRHGLTARTAVLPAEDPAAFRQHCRQFHDEFKPATASETQLVQELADTSWRLNRVPRLEADLLDQPTSSYQLPATIPALAHLGLHGTRLSRQFHKTLETLREIQSERRQHERRELKDAAALLVLHEHKGVPWQPSDHGFVSLRKKFRAAPNA